MSICGSRHFFFSTGVGLNYSMRKQEHFWEIVSTWLIDIALPLYKNAFSYFADIISMVGDLPDTSRRYKNSCSVELSNLYFVCVYMCVCVRV